MHSPKALQPSHRKGVSLAYTGVILMGVGIAVVQVIPINPFALVFYRCLIAAPLLFAFMQLRGTGASIRREDRPALFWIALLTGAHWVSLFASIKAGTVALAIISFYTYPAFCTLIEAIMQKRLPRRADLALALVTLGGVSLFTPLTNASPELLPAVLVGIGSAVCWAGRIVLIHHRMRGYQGESLMFWNLLLTGLLLLPTAFFEASPLQWTFPTWIKVLFLALFVTGLCHTLLLVSLRHISATLFGQIAPIQIVASAVAGWFFLGEPLTSRILLGGSIVSLAGVAAAWTHSPAVRARRKKDPAATVP